MIKEAIITTTLIAGLFLGANIIVPHSKLPSPSSQVLYLAEKGTDPNDDYLVVVDFTLSSRKPRLWVLDENRNTVFNTQVSHGSGSGMDGALRFSNTPNSHMSSLGFMKVGSIYNGKHGSSLKLIGLEPGFNDNVYKRYIVIHTAGYVMNGGRSQGCLALPPDPGKKIIQLLKGKKATVFSYYPDNYYLKNSKILNRS